MMFFGVERPQMDALVISAVHEEEEVMAIREKFGKDVVGFIMGLVRFSDRYRLPSGGRNAI